MLTSRLLLRSFKYSTIKDQISFTDSFRTAISKKLQSRGEKEFLRLQISSGQGCEGYTYKFRFDNQLGVNDYVWQHSKDRVGFAVNEEEFKLLKGSTIDFASNMMKQVFYVKENPNAELSCSCKTSFSPKDHLL